MKIREKGKNSRFNSPNDHLILIVTHFCDTVVPSVGISFSFVNIHNLHSNANAFDFRFYLCSYKFAQNDYYCDCDWVITIEFIVIGFVVFIYPCNIW